MCFLFSFYSFLFILFLFFYFSMKFAGSESLPRVEHFACGGFPSGMEHFHIRWIPFPAGVFCMRQLRGGEASILHHIPHYNDTLNHIHKHSSTKNTGNRPATRAAFPSALIHRLSLASSILSNPSPHQKRHTHHNVRSKKACPERGSARGKYAGFATPSAFPLANFRRETIPGFPPLYHSDTFAFIH